MDGYQTHWGVDHPVFSLARDEQPVLLSSREVDWTRLAEHCRRPGVVSLVTGAPGTGRSTALRWLYGHLSHVGFDVWPFSILSTPKDPSWFLREVAARCGLRTEAEVDVEGLKARLHLMAASGRMLAILVDGADALGAGPPEAWNGLLQLLGMSMAGNAGVCMVLAGGSELKTMVPPAVAVRVACVVSLSAVTEGDARSFVADRLSAARLSPTSLTDDAVAEIVGAAHGNMARLCLLAESSLVEGFVRKTRVVDALMVRSVVANVSMVGQREEAKVTAPAITDRLDQPMRRVSDLFRKPMGDGRGGSGT